MRPTAAWSRNNATCRRGPTIADAGNRTGKSDLGGRSGGKALARTSLVPTVGDVLAPLQAASGWDAGHHAPGPIARSGEGPRKGEWAMRIVILADDVAGSRGLLAEHGFSVWLETRDHRVLFDTGQGLALGHNAAALGITLADAEAVVLSHGHYDHTGGLAAAVSGRRDVPVYAQPEVTARRYARREGRAREVGMPAAARRALREHGAVCSARAPRPVCDGVGVTGSIPRLMAFEDDAGTFYLDADGREPDPLADDQAAFVETRAGTVVLLGCGHAGVVNTLCQVEALTTGPIYAVIGGMHLAAASPERIESTVHALADRDVKCVVPCHCTGLPATTALVRHFGDRCTPGHVGAACEIEA
jgi:7,8-dihydropterin-6-yl-methyl-4-(beta-D-ribofuranosyl)aminobenzene 5'-phosphate synthase